MFILKRYFFVLYLWIWTGVVASCNIEEGDEDNYRLPDNHKPQRYDLNITIDPDSKGFSGQVIVTFKTDSDTDCILLHASPYRISKITKILLNSDQDCKSFYPNNKTEILKINCSTTIKNGTNTLKINYDGLYSPDEDDQYYGLFKSSYQTSEGLESCAFTQFQADYARMAFPCFDEPRFKAVFQITVIHPEKYTVLTNTGISSEMRNGKTVETKFKQTPLVSTYLIAFVISNFKGAIDNSSTPIINIYSRRSQNGNKALALSHTRRFIEALGNWTGIKYEDLGISKLDVVAIPHFPSQAMENWGLITIQEDALLDEGNKTSAEDKRTILFLLAHELAHHWFGNYVTLDWWSDTWLNEGFATLMQYLIPDMIDELSMNLERQFVPLNLHLAFEEDSWDSSPLSSADEDVETRKNISNKFDGISYEKGACIIRMMRNILGHENFRKGVQSYLKKNAYQNTNSKMFLDVLGEFYEDKTNNIFADVMNNWIYKPGYPIVTASINKEGNSVEIQQEELPGNLEDETLWHIPITFTTSQNKNFDNTDIQWLINKEKLEFPIENGSWIILNLQQMGYYRVNYDSELWDRIISVLKKSSEMEKIHVSNRAQLIDDAFSLAKVDKLDFKIVFKLVSYLENENEFECWHAASKHLKYVKRLLEAYGDKDDLQIFKTGVIRLINSVFPSNKIDLEDHLHLLTSQIIYELKCYMDDDECLQSSQRILKKYIMNKTIDDYNTRASALCYGLKTSKTPEDDYKILLEYYNQSDSPIERIVILSSLGCIVSPTVLRRYLLEFLSYNSTISRSDFGNVYADIVFNVQALDTTLSFLNDNLKEIVDRYSDIVDVSELILQPAGWIVSEEQLKYLKEIKEKYQDIEGMADFDISTLDHNKNRQRIKAALENKSFF